MQELCVSFPSQKVYCVGYCLGMGDGGRGVKRNREVGVREYNLPGENSQFITTHEHWGYKGKYQRDAIKMGLLY